MRTNINNLVKIMLLIVAIIAIQSCEKKQLDIYNISAKEKDRNVLRIEVDFEISQDALVEIEYWNSQDTVKLQDEMEAGANSFILIGLESKRKYNYMLSAKIKGKTVKSELKQFITQSLPNNFAKFDLLIDSGAVFDGYLSFRFTKNPAMQVMVNNDAQVVWYQEFDTTVFRPSRITSDHTLLTIENPELIKEYDLFGNVLFELNKGEKGFDKLVHHDILKKNSNYLMLTREKQMVDLSSVGGGVIDSVRSDGILVLDNEGNKIWEWSIFDVFDPLKVKNILKMKGDMGHANSLAVDENGNYLVSFRLFDQIWNIDSNTGKILWKLGVDGDFEMDGDDYFFKQHAAHINADGHLMLFDNGNIFKPISRSISFGLNVENKKVELKTKIILPDSLHTFKMGSAYLIPNNKVLICASTKQKVLITNEHNNNVLWMLDCSRITYRTEYIESLY